MLHIYAMYDILYLPSIDTGAWDCRFDVSSGWHPARIFLVGVHGKCWVLHPGIEPGTISAAGKHINH